MQLSQISIMDLSPNAKRGFRLVGTLISRAEEELIVFSLSLSAFDFQSIDCHICLHSFIYKQIFRNAEDQFEH